MLTLRHIHIADLMKVRNLINASQMFKPPCAVLETAHINYRLRICTFGCIACERIRSHQTATLGHFRMIHTSHLHAKQKMGKKPIILKGGKSLGKSQGKVVEIWDNMTVTELAQMMGRTTDSVFEALSYFDTTSIYNQEQSCIDNKQIVFKVLKKCGFRPKHRSLDDSTESTSKLKVEDAVPQAMTDPSRLLPRPPVVTVMGHVDHGKTTLLDTMRNARVVDDEFGGITQHIGAFTLTLPSGESMTFIDTPGHAAFSAMRARGAMVTDIVVLVVAADDGVMQQTIESLEHAKAANVPIIVAINKIDRPNADVAGAMQDLMEQGIAVEEMGGDVQAVPISALKGTNIDELQEAIITQAELLELKADPHTRVEGVVIEARTDPARGKLATIVIQQGTMKKGDFLVAGTAYGKVRALFNDKNQPISEAGPSEPVEVIGWKELPSAGDVILQVPTEARMKEVIKLRKSHEINIKVAEDMKIIEANRETHHNEYRAIVEEKLRGGYRYYLRKARGKESIETHTGPYLSIMIKGDVDGSIEALLDTLDTYDSTQCELDIVQFGVGNITANDIDMAQAFGAIIYGFNVTCPINIRKLAEDKNVSVRIHHVIYRLFDDLKMELTLKLPPSMQEDIIGEASVEEIYKITERNKKKVNVAGCRCTKGSIVKKMLFRVVREGNTAHEGKLSSLRHFKNEVESVKTDIECGMCFEEKGVEFVKGDIILCYTLTPISQTIDWNLGFSTVDTHAQVR